MLKIPTALLEARRAPTLRSRAHRAALRGLLGLLGLGVLSSTFAANALQVGHPAPSATLVDLDGRHWTTDDLRGRVVILTFWATWCEPCREELPLLSAYAVQHAAEGLTVLAFSVDDPDETNAVSAVAKTLQYPVGLLAASSAPGYGRMWRLPVSFTLNRSGLLVDNGWRDPKPVWTAERLERVVTPLLAAARSPAQGSSAP